MIWDELRKITQARVGLQRSGHALSTKALLELEESHALARDSIGAEWDSLPLELALAQKKIPYLSLQSAVEGSRRTYLQRPDLGRKLQRESRSILESLKLEGQKPRMGVCVSNGLSSFSVQRHSLPLVLGIAEGARKLGIDLAPVFLVPNGRVALGDEIGQLASLQWMVMLIGERPGLSSADSLGIYLTYEPRIGRTDAERNCISNVRPPDGLGYSQALSRLFYLIAQAQKIGATGVILKDESSETPQLPE